MATKRYWVGSTGPFLYDDAHFYADSVLLRAFRTEGQIEIDEEPTEDTHGVRLIDVDSIVGIVNVADIDDPSSELSTKGAVRNGALLVVYESGTPNEYALYAFDTTAGGTDVPTICEGDGGYWICIVGEHAIGGYGSAGKSVLNGTVDPTTEGNLGDFYINTVSWQIFGPKTISGWGTGTSLIGPQGPQGDQGETGPQGIQGETGPTGATGPKGDTGDTGPAGPQGEQGIQGIQGIQGETGATGATGPAGADGKTVLNGAVDPTTEGVDGDFYINTATDTIFGPKTAGSWGSGTSLVGPTGATGPQGIQGIQGETGPTGATGPQGIQGETGATGATGPQGPQGDPGLLEYEVRVNRISISDSIVPSRISCLGTSIHNGYSITEATSIPKGGSSGAFTLSADGATLGIIDSAFPGGLVAMLGFIGTVNESGDYLSMQFDVVLGALYITFRRADGSKADITDSVDIGDITIDFSYLTTS